jgi:hypothetical protein
VLVFSEYRFSAWFVKAFLKIEFRGNLWIFEEIPGQFGLRSKRLKRNLNNNKQFGQSAECSQTGRLVLLGFSVWHIAHGNTAT